MTHGAADQPSGSPKGANDRQNESFPIVGVGASAGGLEAFRKLLQHLPKDSGMGFVLVQHLDPMHESALTQILARDTSLPVSEVTNNLRVRANHVHVIPPNTNLTIVHGVLKLHTRKKAKALQRTIDFFLESLAEDQREMAIGVILSGTATDGTMGLEAIKAEGGITFAQDDSARYDSMPQSAIAAGCVDFVLSPEEIDALEASETFRPHVILFDIGLPQLNGYEVARKLRRQAWAKDVLLVALTGWGQSEDRQKSKDAGFNQHLVKPVDHSALKKLLAESEIGKLRAS